MITKYKVGIIGAGAIVELSHLPVLKNLDEIEIIWQYDKNAERSEVISKMFRVSSIKEEELEDAIKRIDICLLTVPYGVRKTFIEKCAEHGKSLYVEKPFATKAEEHNYYCNLFPSHKLAIGFKRRYSAIVPFLQQLIQSRVFGSLINSRFNQGYFTLKGGNKFFSEVNLSGGGVIIESAIHALDQILLITSAKQVVVKDIKVLHKNLLDFDSVFSSVVYTDNEEISITCEISNLRNLENGLELHFENAAVKCQLTPHSTIKVLSKNNEAVVYLPNLIDHPGANSISQSFYIFWREFINALNLKNTNLTSGNSSILTTSWIDQLY